MLNVFHNSHLIQKCIQNKQQLLILYTLPNLMRVVKNILRKDDMITSIYPDLFQVGSLKKLGCHTDKSEKKSGEQPERNQRAD